MKAIIPLLLSTLLVASCAVVTSDNMVGEAPLEVSPEQWDGVWRNEEVFLQVKVMDGEKGLIKIAWFEEEDDDLKPETMTLQITKGEKWNYVNVLEGSIYEDLPKYGWGRVEKERRRILFWYPNPEQFERAVQSKAIKGEVFRGKEKDRASFHVRISDSSPAIVKEVEAYEGDYFLWDDPLTFFKVD